MLKDFRYLMVLEREGSLSKAAQSMYISQPALSQFLNNVEGRLGFQIFERTAHGIVPTAVGKKYLELVRRLLNSYDGQLDVLLQELNGRRIIRLGIGEQRGSLVLPFLLDASQTRLGGARLKINDAYTDRSELLESLRSHQLDVACITSYGKDSILREFDTVLLAREELFLAVPNCSPAYQRLCSPGGGWIDIAQLRDETFVLCSPKRFLGRYVEKLFTEHEIAPNILHRSNNISTVMDFCLSSGALSIIPRGYIKDRENFCYIPLGQDEVYWNHYSIMLRGKAQLFSDVNEMLSDIFQRFTV